MRTDWMARAFEPLDQGVRCGIGRARETEMDEHAVAAVDLGRPGHLAFDRDDALALLAERFGDELFQPPPEARKTWRRNQRRLVAPLQRKFAEQDTELEPGIFGTVGRTTLRHFPGAIEQQFRVRTQQRGRHKAEVGQRRVAPADARDARENRAKAFLLRCLLAASIPDR